jgi:DNA-binding transcriptional ArsR family regulator
MIDHRPGLLRAAPLNGTRRRPRRQYDRRVCAATPAERGPLPEDQVALAAEVFRMLADGTRIQILWALIDAELSVNEIAGAVGKPGPAVSQHLAKLRMARMVRTRRDGNQIFYQLENDHIQQLVIDGVHNAEHAGPSVPSHHRGPTVSMMRPEPMRGKESTEAR